jgi:hypothetical protein
MPLFEIVQKTDLLPFKRFDADSGLYESNVETLLWENLEALTGAPLFRVARQAKITGGGKPDIIALDQNARVVVIEIKRDVDRMQLAQCLEYAGWARRTNLDELALIYHAGQDPFFKEWEEYTSTPSPLIVNSSARLVLAARRFQGRTEDALNFLRDNAVPVLLLPISLYKDDTGRRLIGRRSRLGAVHRHGRIRHNRRWC